MLLISSYQKHQLPKSFEKKAQLVFFCALVQTMFKVIKDSYGL